LAIPPIPAQGAPWLAYAQGLDDEIRNGRLSDATMRAAFVSVLRPSGDATGATDIAAINAALQANRTVILMGGTFTINAPIRQPSNTTLVLWEAVVFLAAGSNCNLWQNYSLGSALDVNISIRGVGRALFHGNAANQVRQALPKTDGTGGTSMRDNIGIYPVRIDGFRIEDIQVGPTNAYAIAAFGITRFRISRIRLEQDVSTANQDGIDLGPGCQDGVVEDITGRSGDDAIVIMAVHWWKSSANDPVPLAYQVGTALPLSVQDITVRNVHVQAGINLVRILNDADATVTRIHMHGLKNLGRSGIISFGQNDYINAAHVPATGSINGINFEDIQGMSPVSANSGYAVDISSPVRNVVIRNLDVGSYSIGTAYGWKALIGSGNAIRTPVDISNVTLDGVHSANTASADVGDVVKFQAGITLSNITVKNVKLAAANSILNNASLISGLTLSDIEVATIYGNAFRSADTGYFENIRIGTRSGVTTTYGVAVAAKLGPNMPALTAGDLVPVATLDGSRLRTDGTLDPNGAGDTIGGEWVSNGTRWVRASARVDGLATDGLAAPMLSANYYPVMGPNLSTFTFADGTCRGGLVVVGHDSTLTAVGLEVTTAGSAGSVLRLGLYRITPGASGTTALLVDAGTIDATSTGWKELAVSVKVNAGDKILAVAASQGGATTQPIVRGVTGYVPYFAATIPTTASGNLLVGISNTGVTGALPPSQSLGSTTTTIPRLLVKAA
jgi:hypothetical protein